MGKGSNEEAAAGFTPAQVEMYKECFKLMDVNKDGVIDKNDLRGAFDNIGVLMDDGELDGLLGEIGGDCDFNNMVKMFEERLAGEGNDPDDLIIQAFSCYGVEGKIDCKMFEYALMKWGDKMNKAEIDEIFDNYDIDEDYLVKTTEVLKMFVAQKEEEKKAPTPEPEPEPEPVVEEEDPRKKKKKKKAAK